MGKEKQTQTTSSNQQQTYTPTAEETEFNKLQLAQAKEFDPIQRQLNAQGGFLINQLLTGQSLPGYLNSLPTGINPGVTQSIVDQSLKDVNTQLAASGAGTFLESGASQSIGARTAADVRNNAEQFNLQNLQQLLNIAVGGQASVQQPSLTTSAQLSSRLTGLRSISGTGVNTQTTIGMNPFMKSFQTSLGQTLGSPSFKSGGFGF